jgi:hypothetical protein
MAQTKRKRRNKHRGNAVGIVEARGRTSKPREGAAKSSGGRGTSARGGAAAARPLKAPTLQSAAIKALIGCVILFIFFRFLGNGTSTTGALTMCVVAFVLYAPLMLFTDRWIYKRKLRAQGGGPAGARR